MRSMQAGTDWNTYSRKPGRKAGRSNNKQHERELRPTSSKVSLIDLGLPGKLMMRDFPLRPAVCRERTAVGTNLRHMHHG